MTAATVVAVAKNANVIARIAPSRIATVVVMHLTKVMMSETAMSYSFFSFCRCSSLLYF